MAILPRVDVSIRTADLGLATASLDLGLGGGAGAEVSLDTAVGGLTTKVGLAGILAADSPVERLLHGPDALARFRTAAADPSPIATRGMTLRVGDIHAEVATRHDIGGMKTPDVALRTDVALRADAAGVTARVDAGADTRAVPAVRDPAEAGALPQRIDGPAGTTAAARGIDVAIGIPLGRGTTGDATPAPGLSFGAAVAVPTATGRTLDVGPAVPAALAVAANPAGTGAAVGLDGLVNILGRAGTPVVTPQDAPPGAVLVYERADGSIAIELRTATGFAGVNAASANPLTGAAGARIGEGFTLVGVFVPARGGPVAVSPFNLAAAVPEAAASAAATPSAEFAKPAAAEPVRNAASEPPPPLGEARPAGDARGAAPVQPGYANAIATSDLAGIAVRPDGSAIPAGLVVAQHDARPSFGEHGSDPATDRPYVHAIWYDILALRFAEAGVDLLGRSTVLRDVVWATAIEHGPFADAGAGDVLSRVARAIDLPAASDAAIIAALFAERTRTIDGALTHFPEVLPFDRDRVVARLNDEAETALARLPLP